MNEDDTVSGGLRIPGLASWLSDPSTGRDTVVTGLDSVPPEDRPSTAAVNVIHLAWDLMIGMGTALTLLAVWFAVLMWTRRDRLAESTWFLRAAIAAPLAAYVAIESGWIVTEVGRQPWIVWQIMRTEEAVTTTDAGALWAMFSAIMVLYAGLAIGSVLVIRGLTRRWRAQDEAEAAP